MKKVEFYQTPKGRIAEVNGIIVWSIREQTVGWYVYKSKDGGVTFKMIPASIPKNGKGEVIGVTIWRWDFLKDAEAFICQQEFA